MATLSGVRWSATIHAMDAKGEKNGNVEIVSSVIKAGTLPNYVLFQIGDRRFAMSRSLFREWHAVIMAYQSPNPEITDDEETWG